MPLLVSERAKFRMGRRGFRDAKELAARVGLPHSRVRNGVGGHDRLTLADIFVLARALREDNETVEAVVADIVKSEGDGTPDPPPEKKTRDTTAPTRRQDTEDKRTGPKRAQGAERVA